MLWIALVLFILLVGGWVVLLMLSWVYEPSATLYILIVIIVIVAGTIGLYYIASPDIPTINVELTNN